MKQVEILKEQVEALEKLLQLKQAIIEELEDKIRRTQAPTLSPFTQTYPWGGPNTWIGGVPQQGTMTGTNTTGTTVTIGNTGSDVISAHTVDGLQDFDKDFFINNGGN